MKKNITRLASALLTLLFFQSTQAQSWNLTGNSNATTTSKLGTINSIPLNLTTNNATRMSIGTDGKVGIGTTLPQQLFHVEGPTLLSIFVSTSPLSTSSGSGMIGYAKALPTASGQRLGYFLVGSRGGAENNYNAAGMAGFAAGAWSSSSRPSYLSFETTAPGSTTRTERMRIDQNGDVSIPNGNLNIQNGGLSIPFNGNGNIHLSQGVISVLNYDVDNKSAIYAQSGFGDGIFGEGEYNGVVGKGDDGVGVYGDGQLYGVEGNGTTIGVYGHANDTGMVGKGGQVGVRGFVDGNTGYGVYGVATGASGYGVYGSAFRGVYGVGTGSTGYGVYGTAYNGVYGVGTGSGQGVWGTASAASGWGVRGYSALSYGVYGQTGSSSSYAGYFSGNVFTTGTYSSSDRSLKKDITDLTNAMDVIGKLKPRAYTFRNSDDFKAMMLPTGKHYGLIAQEVEEVLPELVKQTEFDAGKANADNKQNSASEIISFKALNYTELIPILIKGMQEQQQEIELLKGEINRLKQGGATTLLGGSLSQSTPNPVKGTARISYNLPDGTSNAKLQITDNLGRTIRIVQLTSSGITNIDVSALSAGIYNYSLVIDNKTVETKKLVVAR